MNKYDVVMGLEIHCELKTKTKCFSSTANTFGATANTQINEVDCGYPGALPIVNEKVVIMAIQTCSALKMEIDSLLRFDRKNYFYPDLPKGYQITQYYHPIGRNGSLSIMVNDSPFTVTFERLHIEEDTAKQIHQNNKTLLDYNRAGIPLLEIVTKPIFTNSDQVIAYINALRHILIYLEVSDAKMNEGSLRCDVNISLKRPNSTTLGTKVEIKNLNSTHNIALAINDEINRQTAILSNKGKIIPETRRFDETSRKTILMRSKENNLDYKYFPEPNLFPIQLDEKWIKTIIQNLPVLPKAIAERLMKQYNLTLTDVNLLIEKRELLLIYEATVAINNLPDVTFKYLFGPVQAYFNTSNITLEKSKLTATNLAQLITLIVEQKINDKQSKQILATIMHEDVETPVQLMKRFDFHLISDNDALTNLFLPLIKKHTDMIKTYHERPEKVLKFFMGQLMKITKGQANPQLAQNILKKLLDDYQK